MIPAPHPLLLPRRKVVSDFPFNHFAFDNTKPIFKVGDVLQLFKADTLDTREYWYHHPIMHQNYQDTWLDRFPLIFQPVEWWEYREVNDMPEYVKYAKTVSKATYSTDKDGAIIMHLDDTKQDWYVIRDIMCFFEPATEAEYIEYKKVK